LKIEPEIVRKRDAHAFEVLPAAGSSSAPWPGSPLTAAALATTKRLPESYAAMILWALVALITQHLAIQRP
jgi:hypothetical protein